MNDFAKRLTVILTALVLLTGFAMGEGEILLNGTFEAWDDANTPTSWTHVESVTQESGASLIHGGTYSAKHTGGTSDLGQYVDVIGGYSYTLTLWYKVTAGDGSDARIWCYWRDGTTSLTDNANELRGPNNLYFDNNGGVWTQYTITLDAPLPADNFYFEVRAYSGAIVYWDDFSFYENAAPSDPEPTNHVSGFSSSPYYHSRVDLSWSDNDGANPAAAFLILVNTTGSFTDPVDGTAQADDIDLSDNVGVKNITSGIESYSFTNLNPSTTYYFKIYPYSNSGENIDYKTDGTVPTAYATTTATPSVPNTGDVYISEISDATGSYTTGYMEIYNNTSNAIDMENCYIDRVASDGITVEYTYTFSLGALIPANSLLIVARGDTEDNFNTEWSVDLSALGCSFDNGHVNLYFTTGRMYKLYDSSDNELDATPTVADNNRIVQLSLDSWTEEAKANATPGTLDTDQALPITLASFSAEAVNGKVNVTWVTESETENAAFRIYRDGEMIAELEGAGTTTEPQSYSYTDQYVIPGRTYSYVLADVDYQGKETKHPRVEVKVELEYADRDYSIGAAYPNPFNPTTIVPLNLAKDALVTATLYDITGRPLRELQNGSLSAGSHALKIDGANLSTGIYFVHVRVNDATHVQKIALMK